MGHSTIFSKVGQLLYLLVCYYFTILILLFYFAVRARPIDNKGLPIFVEILGIIGLL